MNASERGAPQEPRFGVGSFLVADIRGYTAFTSTHGDEAAARLTASFAEIMAEGVEAWAGTLVELRGDEALAVFDSPRSAIRAALELASAFQDEAQGDPGLPLVVGFGLDAGEATPLGDGYRGAALNVASRLCASSAAGEIHASASLVHLAGPIDGIDYGPVEELALKGMAKPFPAVRVTPSGPAEAAQPGAAMGETAASTLTPEPLPLELDPLVPLAGRAAELRWLAWHWRRARHGHARCVVISGLPGIGKTRLAAELASQARMNGATIRYFPSGQGLDAQLVADLVTTSTVLLIVDDLDAASGTDVASTVGLAEGIHGRRSLLVIIHRTQASSALLKSIDSVARPRARRELGPLDLAAVRTIAALYAGDRVDELPLVQIAEETQGHPASIHQAAYGWARRLAAQRVSQVASRTAVDRQQLLDVELELMNGMADLEMAREFGRRYGARDPLVDVGKARAPSSSERDVCPYKGLAAYGARDADLYFGRERLVAELTAKLVGSPFLGIVGASGSGKTSALQAGLLPALAGGVLPGSDAWPQVVMRPGDRPMASLEDALRRDSGDVAAGPVEMLEASIERLPDGGRLVLAVEQFEELFSAVRGSERSTFIDLICDGRPGLVVIITLRADHYGEAAAYPKLARLLAAHQVLVGTLTRSELTAVIEQPAERVGLRVEPELTEALIEDAGSDPSVLPLLSTALLESWATRQDGRLTLSSYRSGGGLHGSVARLADGVWVSLDPDRQAAARAVFLRLAGAGEGTAVTRRRVALGEFDTERDPLLADVLERLIEARLLTADEHTVEVTHEALFREWPRLRTWLEEDASGRRLQVHLAAASREWDAMGRAQADLYRGARLSAALEWSTEHPDQVNALEREFLETGRALAQREADDQRRVNRRLRALLAGTGAVLVVAVIAGVFAAQEATRADRERDVADHERDVAEVGQLTASAIAALGSNPSLAKLLAVEAATSDVAQPEAITALHRAMLTDAIYRRVPLGAALSDPRSWPSVDVHPSKRWVAVAGEGPGAQPWFDVFDLEDRGNEPAWRFHLPDGAVASAARFTPDGSRLVAGAFVSDGLTAAEDRPPAEDVGIGVWAVPADGSTDWELTDWIPLGPCGGTVVDVSDTDALVQFHPEAAAGGQCFFGDEEGGSATLGLLSLDGHELRRLISGSAEGLLSADGRYVAYDDEETGRTVVVDTESLEQVFTSDEAVALDAINRDGSLIVTGDGNLRTWDVATGGAVAVFPATGVAIWGVDFDATGEAVLSVGSDGVVRRWDARSGRELQHFPAFGIGVQPAGDDIALVAGGLERELWLIDPDPRGEPFGVDPCEHLGPRGVPTIASGNLAVADDRLLTVLRCSDQSEQWESVALDQRSGEIIMREPGVIGQVQALTPDGSGFVRQEIGDGADLFGDLTVRDIETGRIRTTLPGTWDQQIKSLTWSPDGSMVAAAAWFDGGLRVWYADGRPVTVIPSGSEAFVDATFDADGRHLLLARSSGDDAVIDVISTEDWAIERSVALAPSESQPSPWVGFAGFSPDASVLYAIRGWGDLHGNDVLMALASDTFEIVDGPVEIDVSDTKSMAMSPGGARLATGHAGGRLKVWSLSDLSLEQEVALGDLLPGQEVQGLAWSDESRLMVALSSGTIIALTTDQGELLDLARASLTRGFTEAECARFEIDPCPTLQELQASQESQAS